MAQQEGRTPAKYRQIAADLRARIEAGEYPVGSQMPTKGELMTSYGAALATVDSGLAVLRKLGMVESRQGSGTFVLAQHPGESEADQLAGQVAGLREAVAELAKRVEVAEDAGLRGKVSELESRLIELYGKTGFDYPEDGAASNRRRDRTARNG